MNFLGNLVKLIENPYVRKRSPVTMGFEVALGVLVAQALFSLNSLDGRLVNRFRRVQLDLIKDIKISWPTSSNDLVVGDEDALAKFRTKLRHVVGILLP